MDATAAVTEETAVGKRMYISDTVLEQIKYPFVKSTVPSWSVPLYNLVGPPVVIAIHAKATSRSSMLSHHGIMGSLFSTSASALITNILKITVRCSSALSTQLLSTCPRSVPGGQNTKHKGASHVLSSKLCRSGDLGPVSSTGVGLTE